MAIPDGREQIAAIDCSFVNKSGKKTSGIDFFYNGSKGKSEKGLEISVISVIDMDTQQAYTLSVKQTPATDRTLIKTKGKPSVLSEQLVSERVKAYLSQIAAARPHLPATVRYLAADSFYSKKSIVDGVVEHRLHLVSKLRIDANLRYCYTGVQKSRGAHRKYDGKVDLKDLSRLDYVGEVDEKLYLYSKVVWHISLKRQIRIAYLVNLQDPKKPRVALLFSTDIEVSPENLYYYYKARFQIEFVFRDAKQFTGLCDCQSRKSESLDFHFNTSLATLNLAKLDSQQPRSDSAEDVQKSSFSMATYKRRASNRYSIELFISMLDLDPTLIKSHPNYETLLQHGSLLL
jgi:Transposase DDE domain